MKADRAEEILHSPDTIEVLYRSSPVWIEDVDKGRNKAYVTYLEQKNTVEVSITQLEEQRPISH